METVLGSAHVEATRLFYLDSRTLFSLNRREIWLPHEIKRSQCGVAHNHKDLKPEPNCTCGIWSCKTRKNLQKLFPTELMLFAASTSKSKLILDSPVQYISARIQQWGVVIEHDYGYRSEFARIIPETIQVYPRTLKPKHKKLVQHLREKYGA